ncbi:hypothetical protein FRB96_002126 [Tulasnella sp. 330]|nr:hypothetical protein FRB96_002126 [Tulasnella sp. 330]
MAIVQLYKDPCALDPVDHFTPRSSDVVVPSWSNADRATRLGRTIMSTQDLAKLVLTYRNMFWDDHRLGEHWWTRVLPHLTNITQVYLEGCSHAFVGTEVSHERLELMELICVHSPDVRQINIKIPGLSSVNRLFDPNVFHLLSGFLDLQELDITAYTEANAECLLVVAKTVARKCGKLRSVRWNAMTRVSNGEDIFQTRVHHYKLMDGIWNAVQAAEKPLVHESASREPMF